MKTALFYAVCRDPRRTCAELLREGKVCRPGQKTAPVSVTEAKRVADAVRRVSAERSGQIAQGGEVSKIRLDGVQDDSEGRQETL